ncbi:MAG: protein-S-isoprenylcysteine O-methyltransferase Ste14 [Paracoccaceae bacterium]|jgi:protein-S-isoprenylcysteine O-methyltransferase Ste14
MKGFPDLPPIWLAGFLILAWLLARIFPIMFVFGPTLQTLGAVFSLIGLAMIGWSATWFMRKKTTIDPHETPEVLIVEGPYRFSRNPIYLGMVAILIGFVVWLGALSTVILPGIFISVISLRFIGPEEEALKLAFGADTERYLRATRRWL